MSSPKDTTGWLSAAARSRWRATSAKRRGFSIAQIAGRWGRSPATVRAYFYDPTGDKARAVKARCVGVCRGCGAYTQPRNGKGDAHAYCKACHPGASQRRWTRERVLGEWFDRYGRLQSSYDWSRTHARRSAGERRARAARPRGTGPRTRDRKAMAVLNGPDAGPKRRGR